MSVLLLTNPFATQHPPPPQSVMPPGSTLPATTVLGLQAVQPAPKTTQQRTPDSATSFAGSGAGAGGQAASGLFGPDPSHSRPTDATPASVVSAQVSQSTALLQVTPSASEPAPDMPDPLPTSPFLKRAAT